MIRCRAPQRSVLDPLLFTIYTAELDDVMKRHGCNLHTYADDNQVYVHCCHSDCVCSGQARRMRETDGQLDGHQQLIKTQRIQDWIDAVWYFAQVEKTSTGNVNISSVVINLVKSAKSLGVTLDDELKLVKHVANVCRSSYYQIRLLKHIRQYPDFDSDSTLVHLFVTSRIDYCNGLLASAPAYQIDQLQRVLNVARLLLRIPRFDWDLQIKVKDKLNWLRVPERVTYKLCTLVYKSLHGLAPGYIAKLCIPVARDSTDDICGLRMSYMSQNILSTYGLRSFSIAGPSTWNSLPQHLRDDKLCHEQRT